MSVFSKKVKGERTSEDQLSFLDDLRTFVSSGDRESFRSTIWMNADKLATYLKGFKLDNADLAYTEAYVNDALPRFLHTLDFIPLTGNLEILELGANPYLFSLILRRLFSHNVSYANFFSENIYDASVNQFNQSIENKESGEYYEFFSTIFNLEVVSPYPYEEESFDAVICCEILEHLVLNPFNLFTEIKRILKPGGRLILTTPNAVRLVNLAAILTGENIFDKFHRVVHGRHNREYTAAELKTISAEFGYEIECLDCRDRFDYNQIEYYSVAYNGDVKMTYTKDELNELLSKEHRTLENRGDNIYLVAVKPA